MFGWFSNKKHPKFWSEYLQKFKGKQSDNLDKIRFVVFDTETTGLDTKNDRILSIGAIAVSSNIIDVSDSFEVFIKQDKFNSKTVEIHGILKEGQGTKEEEVDAIEHFIKFIGNAILVAHHAAFDVEMINQALSRNGLPKLKNKVLDTGILYKKLNNVQDKHYGLDFLSDQFSIVKHDRHNSQGDAYITAIIFLKIMARMRKERKVTIEDLFINRNKNGLL